MVTRIDKSLFPFLLSVLFLAFANLAVAQEGGEGNAGETEEEEPFKLHHSVGLMLLHENISQGLSEGERKWLGVPAWGIDYNFIFHPQWSIGLHTDFVFEEYKVEGEEEGEVIERNFPIAPALVATWKPSEHWGIGIGPGMEFSSEDNFSLIRLGVEYSAELGENGWEFVASVQYDLRFAAYDTFSIGAGVAKSFGER